MRIADRLPRLIAATRVVLVPLQVGDAAEMVEVLAGPDLYTFTGGAPPSHETLARRYAAMVAGSPDEHEEWLNWIVRQGGEAGPAVGTTQATITNEGTTADVAWVIGTAFQGHGYAREAASVMIQALIAARVERITAHIHPDHRASEAVARACDLNPTDEFHDGERKWELRVSARR